MLINLKIDSYGLTDIGKVRNVNEDQFMIANLDKSILIRQTSMIYDDQTRSLGKTQGQLLLVADGIGGKTAGKRGSTIAVDTIIHYVLNMMPWFFRIDQKHEDDLLDELTSALERCESKINTEARAISKQKDMGTTLTMAYVLWPRAYVVHIGANRCYLYSSSQLEQITKDQSAIQHFVDNGPEPQKVKRTTTLWSALGTSGATKTNIEVYKLELQLGDTLLLCTDGLANQVSDQEITGILEGGTSAEDICRQLVRKANQTGSPDNITVVASRYLEEEQVTDELRLKKQMKISNTNDVPASPVSEENNEKYGKHNDKTRTNRTLEQG